MLTNIPNLLTLLRIALIPFITLTFYIQNSWTKWIAALFFVIACLTDFLDGYLARSWRQTTKWGQFFDPIADKLLVSTTLLLLAGFNRLTPFAIIPAVLILCREIMISGLREFLGGLEIRVNVTGLSKIKTVVQMVSICLLLIGENQGPLSLFIEAGEMLLWVAAFLSMITGFQYMKKSYDYIR